MGVVVRHRKHSIASLLVRRDVAVDVIQLSRCYCRSGSSFAESLEAAKITLLIRIAALYLRVALCTAFVSPRDCSQFQLLVVVDSTCLGILYRRANPTSRLALSSSSSDREIDRRDPRFVTESRAILDARAITLFHVRRDAIIPLPPRSIQKYAGHARPWKALDASHRKERDRRRVSTRWRVFPYMRVTRASMLLTAAGQ